MSENSTPIDWFSPKLTEIIWEHVYPDYQWSFSAPKPIPPGQLFAE